jgi:predicted nucleic acid-binding Zn ribbon protein
MQIWDICDMAKKKYSPRRYRVWYCLICDRPFKRSRDDAAFCSPRCRKVYNRRKKAGIRETTMRVGAAPSLPRERKKKGEGEDTPTEAGQLPRVLPAPRSSPDNSD